MNEKLKELAMQADEGYTGNSEDALGASLVGNDAIKKFAELIVRECIDKISQEQNIAEQNWQCKNGVHICHELTKHFGVKNG